MLDTPGCGDLKGMKHRNVHVRRKDRDVQLGKAGVLCALATGECRCRVQSGNQTQLRNAIGLELESLPVVSAADSEAEFSAWQLVWSTGHDTVHRPFLGKADVIKGCFQSVDGVSRVTTKRENVINRDGISIGIR